MRLRRLSVVVATLSVVVAMAGCMRGAPPITDEQVEAWRALGEEMIPAATVIDVEASQATTMAGNSNQLSITVAFADFYDLKDHYQLAEEYEAAIRERAPRAGVNINVVNQGAAAFEAEVESRLLDNVPGIEQVYANSRALSDPATEPPTLWVTPYLYVSDPEAIDTAWLDNVADHTQQVATDVGAQIYSLVVLPTVVMGVDVYSAQAEEAMIPVQDLPAFADLGGDGSCLRTENWAYDVTNDWVIVHPAGEPEGACA